MGRAWLVSYDRISLVWSWLFVSVWLNAKPRWRRIRCVARTFLIAFWNLASAIITAAAWCEDSLLLSRAVV